MKSLNYGFRQCPRHAEVCKLPSIVANLYLTSIQALIMKERGVSTERLLYKNMTGA